MKKIKTATLIIAAAAMLAACSAGSESKNETAATVLAEEEVTKTEEDPGTTVSVQPEDADEPEEAEADEEVVIRVGSLKGPTSIGLLSLMDKAESGMKENNYDFTMAVQADELSAGIVGGTLDIALLPANVASVLYNRTSGDVSVIDINTLGVIDVVTADESVTSFADLRGKTIYMTGKGTTPDYAFRYLLAANGISEDEVDLEFKSEATEVAVLLQEEPDSIGVLPQPFVTSACMQNEDLRIALDLTEEWDKVQGEGGSRLLTGVTIVRNDFLEENPEAVFMFLEDHRDSTEFTRTNPDETAELVAEAGIIEKPEVAKIAIPYCNITCITGDEMKAALTGYLGVLYDQDPSSVGGELPGDDFYYIR